MFIHTLDFATRDADMQCFIASLFFDSSRAENLIMNKNNDNNVFIIPFLPLIKSSVINPVLAAYALPFNYVHIFSLPPIVVNCDVHVCLTDFNVQSLPCQTFLVLSTMV